MRINYYKNSKMSPSKYKCEYVIALRYKYPLHNVPPLSINYLNYGAFKYMLAGLTFGILNHVTSMCSSCDVTIYCITASEPIMAYNRRLRPKGVPFSGFWYIKGRDFSN